jgi:hypothetical protein
MLGMTCSKDARMQQTTAMPPAERMAKHRAGVATQLREIKAETSAMKSELADLREALEAALIRRSISNSESRNAD